MFVERRDTFAIVPTGFGKSLTFQAVSLIGKKLGLVVNAVNKKHREQTTTNTSKSVMSNISPGIRGFPARCLHSEEVDFESTHYL